MVSARGTVVASPELLDAARTRFDLLASFHELRVAKAWELVLVSLRLVGLASVSGAPIEIADVVGAANLATGAAAIASSPRASDLVLGRASAKRGSRSAVIEHERRPIDPMDFFWAFMLAAIAKEAAVLAALDRAVEDIDPDPAFSGRGGHERSLFRLSFGSLAAAGVGDWKRAREAATAARHQSELHLRELETYRLERFEALVLPLVAGLSEDDPKRAVDSTLRLHHAHWSASYRHNDPSGFIAWGPLALAALRGLAGSDMPVTDYIPEGLRALLDGPGDAGPVTLSYEVRGLAARSLEDATLRVGLSSPGPIDVLETDAGASVVLSTRGLIVFSYAFEIGEKHDGKSLLDIGELVFVAERELARMRTAAPGSQDHREAQSLGLACANRALELRGDDPEIYRDRMTSPLGRNLCDEQPDRLTRAAIEALAKAFS